MYNKGGIVYGIIYDSVCQEWRVDTAIYCVIIGDAGTNCDTYVLMS